MLIALAVHVDGEGQVLRRREQVELLAEEQRVGAEVNVLLARDQAGDDLGDLRVHQRLAAGDGDHRGAAFLDRAETFVGREVLLEDVRGVLDFAAAGAGEVAAEERLEHQDERVALATAQALAKNIGSDRPHLRYRNCHRA